MNWRLINIDRQYTYFRLLYYGSMNCLANWESEGKIIDGVLIHFIKNGRGVLETSGKKFQIGENSYFILYPNSTYHYQADYEHPWEYTWICFTSEFFEHFLKSNLCLDNSVFYCGDNLELEETLKNMLDFQPEDTIIDEMYYTSLLANIMRLMKNAEKIEPIGSSMQLPNTICNNFENKCILEATGYIQVHYGDDINVNSISSYLGLDRSYFSRIFKKHLKVSPSEFLLNYRLDRACELLSKSDMKINEISVLTGFTYVHNFSEMFKKRMGLNPQTYRLDISSAKNNLDGGQ